MKEKPSDPVAESARQDRDARFFSVAGAAAGAGLVAWAGLAVLLLQNFPMSKAVSPGEPGGASWPLFPTWPVILALATVGLAVATIATTLRGRARGILLAAIGALGMLVLDPLIYFAAMPHYLGATVSRVLPAVALSVLWVLNRATVRRSGRSKVASLRLIAAGLIAVAALRGIGGLFATSWMGFSMVLGEGGHAKMLLLFMPYIFPLAAQVFGLMAVAILTLRLCKPGVSPGLRRWMDAMICTAAAGFVLGLVAWLPWGGSMLTPWGIKWGAAVGIYFDGWLLFTLGLWELAKGPQVKSAAGVVALGDLSATPEEGKVWPGMNRRTIELGEALLGILVAGMALATLFWIVHGAPRWTWLAGNSSSGVPVLHQFPLVGLALTLGGLAIVTVAVSVRGYRRAACLLSVGLAGVLGIYLWGYAAELPESFRDLVNQLSWALPVSLLWVFNRPELAAARPTAAAILRPLAAGALLFVGCGQLGLRIDHLNLFRFDRVMAGTTPGFWLATTGSFMQAGCGISAAILALMAELRHLGRFSIAAIVSIDSCLYASVVGLLILTVSRSGLSTAGQSEIILLRAAAAIFWMLATLALLDWLGGGRQDGDNGLPA